MAEYGFTRPQLSVTIEISAERIAAELAKNIAGTVSRITGGCGVTPYNGFWAEDGAERGLSGYSDIHAEEGIRIDFSIDDNVAAESRIAEIQNAIRAVIPANSGINWIHCAVKKSYGFHFSINE
jgi:hypothetical protein